MQSVDAQQMIFDAAKQGVFNIIGDYAVAVVGIISVLLIVFGLRWLLEGAFYNRAVERAEEDVRWHYEGISNSDPAFRDVAKARYRLSVKKLIDLENRK